MSRITVSGDQGVGEVSMTEWVLSLSVVEGVLILGSGTTTTIKSSPNEVRYYRKKKRLTRYTKHCWRNIGHYKRTSTMWSRRKTMRFHGCVMCKETWTVSGTTKPMS
jgi:hypothetical protein